MDGPSTFLTNPLDAEAEPKQFTFDYSYDWDTTQDLVYGDLGKPMVTAAFDGFNGTVFAYGQTGSGKSWSMMGAQEKAAPELDGIIPRLNTELFEQLEAAKAKEPDKQFMILVSYLEIYNEVIKDLLNPSDKKLQVRQHPKLGVYVQDLAEIVATGPEQVADLLESGNKVRKVAGTKMNARSSRSHSCFTIKIEQKVEEDMGGGKRKTTTLNAKLNLVDLAGSERQSKTGAEGAQLREGAAINKSLSVLGNVINALAEGKKHVPYRDSKLTRLLQNSLGGNSRTVMIAAISPADDNYDETLTTLNYANRAKNITNKSTRNEDVSQQIIRELRSEIADLRAALEAAQSGVAQGGGAMSEEQQRQIEEMSEKMAMLERAKKESWEEKQRLSQQYEEERKRNAENTAKIMAFMNTVREDNLALIKRVKDLKAEKNELAKLFKSRKAEHMATRQELADAMAEYDELAVEGEDGPHAARLEELIGVIESRHQQVEEETVELRELKEALREINEQLEEAMDEAAAQRMVLEEDAQLREQIKAEERERLEKANAERLESVLAEEKERLRREMEADKKAAIDRMVAGGMGSATMDPASAEAMQRLEVELLDAKQALRLMELEAAQTAQRQEAEVAKVQAAHRREMRALKSKELRMFRELCDGYEEEHKALRKEVAEKNKLLRQAVSDITFLTQKNAELERQLIEAAAWEPTM
ncbi:Kif17 [Symbiodinium sp. KB8]|nr:Kif17 [Symbiodinium sp. KB8]